MRICHVNLAGGYRGGERQTELLVRQLSTRGLEQTLVVGEDSELAGRVADVPLLTIKSIRKPYWFRWGQLEGDLVHAHENKGAHLAHLGHRFGGRPYILTRRIAKQPSASRVTHDMYRRAARVVGVARTITDVIGTYEPAARTAVVYSAISELPSDPARVEALRTGWSGKRVILNVAALNNYQKGQLHLIEAARLLRERFDDLHFVCCGGGPDEAMLREAAADLENVEFAGFVNNVGDYLAAADVFILPSLWEGLGTSTLDAMAAGLPCIASAVDGLPEIVRDGETGLLVPPADPVALADAIARVLGDAEFSRRLALAGKAFAADFRPSNMADRYLEIYEATNAASTSVTA